MSLVKNFLIKEISIIDFTKMNMKLKVLRFRNEKVTIIDYGVGNTKSLKMVL